MEITMLKGINNKIRNLLADWVMKTSMFLINLQQIMCSGREIVKVVVSQISTMSMNMRKVSKEMTTTKIETISTVQQGGVTFQH